MNWLAPLPSLQWTGSLAGFAGCVPRIASSLALGLKSGLTLGLFGGLARFAFLASSSLDPVLLLALQTGNSAQLPRLLCKPPLAQQRGLRAALIAACSACRFSTTGSSAAGFVRNFSTAVVLAREAEARRSPKPRP